MTNKLSYQDAFLELQDIVQKIERGEVEIDTLSEMIKRASSLIEVCNTKLTTTEEEVEKLLEKLTEKESLGNSETSESLENNETGEEE